MTWGCSTPWRAHAAPAGSELYRDRERAQALHYVQPHSLPCLVPDGRSDGLSHLAAHGQADGICRHVGSERLTEAEGRLVLLRAGATVPHWLSHRPRPVGAGCGPHKSDGFALREGITKNREVCPVTELSIFAFQPVSVLRGPVKSRSFRLYELLRGPQGKRRSAHSALERPGRMSIFSAAVTQIMIYVLFSIKKIRVFEGGTQNVEREVGRPAKCVGSFEDGFGEITSPLKKIFQ